MKICLIWMFVDQLLSKGTFGEKENFTCFELIEYISSRLSNAETSDIR